MKGTGTVVFAALMVLSVPRPGGANDPLAARHLIYLHGAIVQAQHHMGGEQAYGGAASNRAGLSLDDAYAVLNVSASSSDAEVKKAYRRLMSQHHPDKLVAKGLPEEMMELAKEKTQEIRAAYDVIKNSRGMK